MAKHTINERVNKNTLKKIYIFKKNIKQTEQKQNNLKKTIKDKCNCKNEENILYTNKRCLQQMSHNIPH